MKDELKLVIVTGMSGAGKTVAMQSLEDAGFYCIDNLPPQLIPTFPTVIEKSNHHIKKLAIATDLRTLDFLESLPDVLTELASFKNMDFKMIYLDANDEALIKRYKQSRRKHPMTSDSSPLNGIQTERKLLEDIQRKADITIDTSHLKPIQLKEKLVTYMTNNESDMLVNVMSFGFKHGIPLDADLVFDVRFLPNPHYVEHLRPKTGKEKDVSDYVFSSDKTKEYVEKLIDLLSFSLPEYKKEGKQQLVIAIGCTGGKHRSVALAEKIGNIFKEQYSVFINHRDSGKE